MPVSYDYDHGMRAVGCTVCGVSVPTRDPFNADAISAIDGMRLSDVFRFHSTSQRFFSQCRSCANARSADRRRARAANVIDQTSAVVRRALGMERKYGVEIELIFPYGVDTYDVANAIEAAGVVGWRAKGDGSLSGSGEGIEVVSPPMTGEEGLEAIRTVCRVVQEMGASVNTTCGLHVHHDVADLDVEGLKRVARGWANSQSLIDGLVSRSRRDGGSYYCRPIPDDELRRIEGCETVQQMRRCIDSSTNERYRSLNYGALGRYGTIEIRQHQGTMNAEKITSWIMFGKAIIDHAHVNDEPLPTGLNRMRDMFSRLGDHLNETAKTFLLGRAVEFDHVTV